MKKKLFTTMWTEKGVGGKRNTPLLMPPKAGANPNKMI